MNFEVALEDTFGKIICSYHRSLFQHVIHATRWRTDQAPSVLDLGVTRAPNDAS